MVIDNERVKRRFENQLDRYKHIFCAKCKFTRKCRSQRDIMVCLLERVNPPGEEFMFED